MPTPIVLPRPGTNYRPLPPLPAPTEQAFTSTFGALLPRARYLTTPHGKAAYYLFPSTSPQVAASSPAQQPSRETVKGSGQGPPSRVLLIHGVQTPALGLVPLVSALRSQVPVLEVALVDLWGHGLSEAPRGPVTAGLFAGLVDGVVGALGWKGDGGEGEEGVKEGTAVVGYSFGSVVGMGWVGGLFGSGAGREGNGNGNGAGLHSLTLVAPAGLLRRDWFSELEQGWLSTDCKPEDEEEAAEFVVRALEGGPLVVPADWRDRVARGEVVAQAVKEWQLREHEGHRATVVGVFRDGGVFENQELFRRTKDTGVPVLAVLGELDELSTVEEVEGFGFETRVVLGAGHGVVRERAEEVAERIAEYWRSL